jgi:hypothetical protein
MVKIILTKSQITQLSKASSREVTLLLTQEQSEIISKSFTQIAIDSLKKLTVLREAASEAAPFRPAGSVVSATITGVSDEKGAIGSVSGS